MDWVEKTKKTSYTLRVMNWWTVRELNPLEFGSEALSSACTALFSCFKKTFKRQTRNFYIPRPTPEGDFGYLSAV